MDCTVLQKGKVGKWQVIWCLRRPQIIHDVGSLYISTMWLFNFFLVKRTLKQELQVKETSGKKDQGEFDQHGSTRPSSTIPYLLFPSISYSTSERSFFSSSSSCCSSSLRRFGKPPGPPYSPAGTCRTGTGLLLPKLQKY